MIFVVDKTSETIYRNSGNQRYNRWSDGGLKSQAETHIATSCHVYRKDGMTYLKIPSCWWFQPRAQSRGLPSGKLT